MAIRSKLLNILFWLIKIYTEQVLKAQRSVAVLIFLKIKRSALDEYKHLKLKTVGEIALYTADTLLFDNADNKVKENLSAIASDLEGYVKLQSERDDIRLLLAQYHALTHFRYSTISKSYFKKEIAEAAQRYRSYHQDFIEFTRASFSKFYNEIKSKIKLEKSEIKRISRQIINNDVDIATPKIEIKAQTISFFLSLLATLFVAAGYFYSKYYLGSFGIEVSHFFSLSDYLASSIDKISAIAIATLLAFASYLYGFYCRLSEAVAAEHYDADLKNMDLEFFLGTLALSALLIVASYFGSESKHYLMVMLLFILAMVVINRLPLKKLFVNHWQVRCTLILISVFSIHLFNSIYKDVRRVKSAEFAPSYKMQFSDEYSDLGEKARLISSTSSHYFVFNPDDGNAYIVARDKVSLIRAASY